MTMTVGLALLAVAAAIVLAAILANRQPLLLLGVALYVGITLWLAYVQPVLMLPALGGAVALEIIGLRRVLREQAAAEPVTPHHNSTTIVPNNMSRSGDD